MNEVYAFNSIEDVGFLIMNNNIKQFNFFKCFLIYHLKKLSQKKNYQHIFVNDFSRNSGK